jgi:hypothetical protein
MKTENAPRPFFENRSVLWAQRKQKTEAKEREGGKSFGPGRVRAESVQRENQFAATGLIAAAMWARTPAGSAASSIVN